MVKIASFRLRISEPEQFSEARLSILGACISIIEVLQDRAARLRL